MKLYLLTWLAVSYKCPWGLGVLPEHAKAFVCQRQERLQVEVSPHSLVIEGKIRELGPNVLAQLNEIEGSQKRELKILWDHVLRVER